MNQILWIMCGAPGSGKSYFAKNILWKNTKSYYISRDEIRYEMVEPGESYFKKETAVFNEFIKRIQIIIDSKVEANIIVDATHLNTASRMKLLRHLNLNSNIKVIPVWMKTSERTCLARNKTRTGRECVPEDALHRMFMSRSHPSKDPYKYAGILEVNE